MPLQATSGAASYDAFGGGVPVVPVYIEQIFSTYLFNGTSPSNNVINNGIDLATFGGLNWTKGRNQNYGSQLFDSARGPLNVLQTNTTAAQAYNATYNQQFNNNGFTWLSGGGWDSSVSQVSWTFRKQPKFFDIVTYTGNGSTQNIAHSLGSTPGCILVKCTSNAGQDWFVYHRTQGNGYGLLNTTDSWGTYTGYWNDTAPTSTQFSVGTSNGVNGSGQTYVAYLFAHDAGGFGLTGTDNVISCGSASTDSSGNWTATLGYEPQWILWRSTGSGNWQLVDNMRGASVTDSQRLYPNQSFAESSAGGPNVYPTATGFVCVSGSGPANGTIIYIAIRRGPMKVPTDATKVFKPTTGTVSVNSVVTTGFATDMVITAGTGVYERGINDRLRGFPLTNTGTSPWLVTQSTAAEANYAGTNTLFNATNTTFQQGYYFSGAGAAQYSFLRAPSFFDEVCCNTASTLVNHNLGVAPEMVIYKARGLADNWYVCTANNGYGRLSGTVAWAGLANGSGLGVNLANVSSTQLSSGQPLEGPGYDMVVYLFATCAGVSKVGSYTGTGTTLQIDCGFTAGARFVLIKRTDSTGDWYVWDTARGIVSGNDPYLLLNSSAAEVTSTDYIDPYSAGFEISSSAPAAINASGGSFIFLAIA